MADRYWAVTYGGRKIGEDFHDGTMVLEVAGKHLTSNIVIGPPSMDYIFGDGSDGNVDLLITETATNNRNMESGVVDYGFIERNYEALHIGPQGILKASQRNAGMIIRVRGDCEIEGQIINQMAPRSWDMTQEEMEIFRQYYPALLTEERAKGGDGGNAHVSNNGGDGQIGRFYGGGYGGGNPGQSATYNSKTGYGGKGGSGAQCDVHHSFGGGAGATATGTSQVTAAVNGGAGGGPGGGGGGAVGRPTSGHTYGTAYGGSGGGVGAAGTNGRFDANGRGAYGFGGSGGGYAGGAIILYVGGDLIIRDTAIIDVSGRSAGEGAAGTGGGGGGGVIYICHKGIYTNLGTMKRNGGARVGSSGNQTAGKQGAFEVEQFIE